MEVANPRNGPVTSTQPGKDAKAGTKVLSNDSRESVIKITPL